MFGWKGKILRVDLSNGNCFVEDMNTDLAEGFIGGRGMGVKILFDEIDPNIDPLGPENKLIFATGPLTGTGVPAGGRFIVVSKSPLTGGIANPCCGGYFGANLKFAGYDLLIVENVGNLVCPATFQLGTHKSILIASIPEGDDKPYKYPGMYRDVDVLVINKVDLLPYIPFKLDYFQRGVEILSPNLETFAISCTTGEGFDPWIAWLTGELSGYKTKKLGEESS